MKLKITTPGKTIVVHGKLARTPVEIKIANDQQLSFYETLCRTQSFDYHLILTNDDKLPKPEMIVDDNSYELEPVIEELKTGRLLDELTKK